MATFVGQVTQKALGSWEIMSRFIQGDCEWCLIHGRWILSYRKYSHIKYAAGDLKQNIRLGNSRRGVVLESWVS